jgi:Protein of unknown function (DUF1275)
MNREPVRQRAISYPLRDPIVPLLLLIATTTGLVDAVSVLGLGLVFCANMTGNIVFLGFALAEIPQRRAARHGPCRIHCRSDRLGAHRQILCHPLQAQLAVRRDLL